LCTRWCYRRSSSITGISLSQVANGRFAHELLRDGRVVRILDGWEPEGYTIYAVYLTSGASLSDY
jgi:hypothetical protein